MKICLEYLNYDDADHVGLIYKIRTHPDVVGYFFAPPPRRFLDHVQFLAKCEESGERSFFIISLNGRYCGYCQIIYRSDSYELGFALHPSYWGKGVGSSSVDLLLKYISSDQFEKKKIILQVRENNARAIHLYQKHGFKIVDKISGEEGYLMELCKNGIAQKL